MVGLESQSVSEWSFSVEGFCEVFNREPASPPLDQSGDVIQAVHSKCYFLFLLVINKNDK